MARCLSSATVSMRRACSHRFGRGSMPLTILTCVEAARRPIRSPVRVSWPVRWMHADFRTDCPDELDGLCASMVHPVGEVVVVDAVPLSPPVVVPEVECPVMDREVVTRPDGAQEVDDRVEFFAPCHVSDI